MCTSGEHGFVLDPSRLGKKDLTETQLATLEAELNSVFRPSADPNDLPKDLRLQVEQTLDEFPDKLRGNIKALKQLIEGESNLNSRTDELFLAAFLRGRKHDVPKAFQCLKNFYDFKSRYPDMYTFSYPSVNPEVYAQNHFGNVPGLDRKGRKICFIIPARLKLDEIPVLESFKLGTSMLEMMLNDLTLQVSGTVFVIDMANLSFVTQARLATPSMAWHLCMIVQDKIPMRLKAIHVINQPFYFNACYAVFKPFLKKKIRKRVFLHGSDMKSLHSHIDPSELPVEYDGNRPPFSSLLTTSLLQLNEFKFKEWEKFGYTNK